MVGDERLEIVLFQVDVNKINIIKHAFFSHVYELGS